MLYIHHTSTDPFYNHAIEEYIMDNFTEEAFILWQNRPSILIGRNQNTASEINQEFVRNHGIDVVRRLSGGGTVFCDLGNFNFTFITNKGSEKESFETFARPVIEALKSLGVQADFSGRNDITIEGKKISGNAQYHHGNRLLHHGTLLFNGDLSSLKGALISKPLKFKDKSVKSVASRVTNIYPHLKSPMSVEAFKDYLKNFIMDYHHIDREYILTEAENQKVLDISKNRFESWEWNYGKSPKYDYHHSVKYPSGLIEYYMSIKKGHITDLSIYGDFFGQKPIEELTGQLIGTPHDYDALTVKLKDLNISDYISGLDVKALVSDLTQPGPQDQE